MQPATATMARARSIAIVAVAIGPAVGAFLGAWVGDVVVFAAAALVVVVGAPQISSRQRAAFGVVAVAYGLAIGVQGPAAPILAPVLLMILRPLRVRGRGFPPPRYVAVVVGLSVAGALGCWAWWAFRPGFAFYSLFPAWIADDRVLLIIGILTAAAFNATWEELLWRRLLFSTLPVRSQGMRILVLSTLFGLAHLHALPGGWTGVLLTGLFAAAMHYVCGKMRAGLLVAIVVHFVADVVLLSLVTLGS